MLVGRITKDTSDSRRVTVSFVDWLDTNEAIRSTTTPVVAVQQNAVWGQGQPFTVMPQPTPTDPTPLTVGSISVSNVTCDDTGVTYTAAGVTMFLNSGTPGVTYKVTFTATGSISGRVKQIDLLVTVRQPA